MLTRQTTEREMQMARYGVGVLSIVVIAATAVLAGACGMQPGGTQQQVGKMQEESKSVDLKKAQTARAQLKMGAGELNVTGGADQLMEGDFSYNVSEWKPKVSYDVSGQKGELVVKQGALRAAASRVKRATSGTSASTTRCRPISWCRWERERAILIWTASPLRGST